MFKKIIPVFIIFFLINCNVDYFLDDRRIPVIKPPVLPGSVPSPVPTPTPTIPPDTIIISTVGGSKEAGFGGDGGPVEKALFNNPAGLTVDKDGNIYVADRNNNRIRKIDNNGIITTIAGGGTEEKDGMATQVLLKWPVDVTADSQGNIYIAEQLGHRIRKIKKDKPDYLVTIAGTGIASRGVNNVLATSTELNAPVGITIDLNGNVLIADSINSVIKKIDTKGISTTIAGDGIYLFKGDGSTALKASLVLPQDVWIDKNGNLYIADAGNKRIRKVDTNNIITTIAGNGEMDYKENKVYATNTSAGTPYSIVSNDDGTEIYFTDFWNNLIRKIDTKGDIDIIAGCPSNKCQTDLNYQYLLDEKNIKSAKHNSIFAPYGITIKDEIIFFTAGNMLYKLEKFK